MEHRDIKDALYMNFARIGKALSSPTRLEIVDLLAQGELSVEDIASKAELSIGNTSAHLKTLFAACLVNRRRAGQRIFYALANAGVSGLMRHFQEVAEEQIAEVNQIVQRYYETPGELDPITSSELVDRMQDGDVVVLDVRPIDEFRSAHIAGAVPLPIDELEQRLKELPSDVEIVAYCRGRYCLYAVEAVRILRAHGFRARRLNVGLPNWRDHGLPVA
ncbi:MAG: metalloregulator ArsR/SmtB family transcription factor [Proteobacteria bacterium]|nr:metalloregulator ArsR/SmtB family transcription factor [Pseudomonadota bacterium]